MSSRTFRRLRLLAAASAVAVLAGITTTSAAHADLWGPYAAINNAYWGAATGDVLQYGSSSNETAFWQAALANYGQVPTNGIDGVFGVQTWVGTRNVQAFWGIPADGVVGNGTWTEASRWTTTVYSGGLYAETWFPWGTNTAAFSGHQIVGGTFAGYWGWSSCYVNGVNFTNTSAASRTISTGHWCGP